VQDTKRHHPLLVWNRHSADLGYLISERLFIKFASKTMLGWPIRKKTSRCQFTRRHHWRWILVVDNRGQNDRLNHEIAIKFYLGAWFRTHGATTLCTGPRSRPLTCENNQPVELTEPPHTATELLPCSQNPI